MLWTDLTTMKKILQIDPDNTAEDWLLNQYNVWVTDILSTLLNRDFDYKVRTTYYKGTGNQKLTLKHRPVYPLAAPASASTQPFQALTVITDDSGYFGFAPGAFGSDNTALPLTLGVDYTLNPDRDDGGSTEAILYRINDYWTRPFVRQNGSLSPFVGPDLGSIKVQYTAGYTVDTLPDQLRFAANLLVAKIRYLMPVGMEISTDTFVNRTFNLNQNQRQYLIGLVKHHVLQYRNWVF